ncbi:SMI1/KNR4 family protein [Streptomyces sp. 4N509B]|uniref:SMI1/KNR4 family protein n=1 Tax=Streptomyces sp. 4N509B TaxID=3457413 RepID=UPI003FD5F661
MTSHAGDSLGPPVADSWARIDAWLARHAPVSRGLLRPPATPTDVEAAERRLGLTFCPDLVASLLCHDGTERGAGAPVLSFCGPFAGLAELVRDAELLRSVNDHVYPQDGDADEEGEKEGAELAAFWRREWLLVTRGIGWEAQDGLFVTCREGEHYGRVGRFFNEDAPSFTEWASLRQVVAAFADALERRLPVRGQVPVAFEGRLLWDTETSVVPRPRSPLTLAGETPEPTAPPPAPIPAPPRPRQHGASIELMVVRRGAPAPPEPYQPGLVFAAGLGPDELLRRIGVRPETLRERSRRQARHAAAGAWAARLPLMRAGTAREWAFALDEAGEAQGRRPEVLRRVSAGTRAVALWKDGPEVRLVAYGDGTPAGDVEVFRSRPGGVGRRTIGAAARTVQYGVGDRWPDASAAYTRLVASLEGRFGIAFDPELASAQELLSGLVLPLLPDLPEPARRRPLVGRDFDLADLVARTEPEVLRAALTAQLRRLTGETGLGAHPEIPPALDRLARGEAVPLTDDDPLGVRLRTVFAEARAAEPPRGRRRGGDEPPLLVTQDEGLAWQQRARAGSALRHVAELPAPLAAPAVLNARLSADWRRELTSDLAAARSALGG